MTRHVRAKQQQPLNSTRRRIVFDGVPKGRAPKSGLEKQAARRPKLRKVFGRLAFASLVCAGLVVLLAQHGAAQPLAGSAAGGQNAAGFGLVTKVHGFHCRKELGWDPRAGVYRYHRHEGICKDYKRCMREMYRCNLLMGRGWDAWSYERWGWDNWRFSSCMLDAGCY
jgi:hypothetical protein